MGQLQLSPGQSEAPPWVQCPSTRPRPEGAKHVWGYGWLRPFDRYGPTGPRIGGFALNVPNEFGAAMGAPG